MNITRNITRLVGALAIAVLVIPLTFATSQAEEVSVKMQWTGTTRDTSMDTNQDGLAVGVIDAEARGTFGPKVLHIITEFAPATPPPDDGYCSNSWELYALILFSQGVVTYANHDQLFFEVPAGGGWMCLDYSDGTFEGEVTYGEYVGGTGRFVDASGSFAGPFEGHNPVFLTGHPSFAPIRGELQGTLVLK